MFNIMGFYYLIIGGWIGALVYIGFCYFFYYFEGCFSGYGITFDGAFRGYSYSFYYLITFAGIAFLGGCLSCLNPEIEALWSFANANLFMVSGYAAILF